MNLGVPVIQCPESFSLKYSWCTLNHTLHNNTILTLHTLVIHCGGLFYKQQEVKNDEDYSVFWTQLAQRLGHLP
jgi:hypothetical protein